MVSNQHNNNNNKNRNDHDFISSLIRKCRYENNNHNDVDGRIELLQQINSSLPKSIRIKMPSLITDDYVDKALDIIEERIIRKNKGYVAA